jgi:hypothetical protein
MLQRLEDIQHQSKMAASLVALQIHRTPRFGLRGAGSISAEAVGVCSNREAATRFALRLDMGKMDIQLIANEEKQDRAEGRKDEAGGMITFVSRARKHVGNGAADDRTDDAEHDCPEDC